MANSLAQAQKWLRFLMDQDVPFKDALSRQVVAGKVGALCGCGCHGFDFHVPDDSDVPKLKQGNGLFYEMAFESNFPEEIDVLLFTDERGFLSRVDVTYGATNIGPMPEGIAPASPIGKWPSNA